MSCALAWFFVSVGLSFSQTRVAVLDFGASSTGLRAASEIRKAFATKAPDESAVAQFEIIDPDLARAAALGAAHKGSPNLTIEEARDLGAAIGCDFYFLGGAETLKRSPSTGSSYFESFASVFLVSARTGRLVLWERPNVQRGSPEESEKALLAMLAAEETRQRYIIAIRRALEQERVERASVTEISAPVIDVMLDENSETDKDLRAPRAYRRLKPPYPETAARAETEATVDALVDIDARGEVGRVEIVRWAGYGLDQSVVDTVKQMHFFPAMRHGIAIPMRVLLRYNFRKPPIQNSTQQKPSIEHEF
jgi:TonB family protein